MLVVPCGSLGHPQADAGNHAITTFALTATLATLAWLTRDRSARLRIHLVAVVGIVGVWAVAAGQALESERNQDAIERLCHEVIALKGAVNDIGNPNARFSATADSCGVDWARDGP